MALKIKVHSESEIEANVFKELNPILKRFGFRITHGHLIPLKEGRSFIPDWCIFTKNNSFYAIIEVSQLPYESSFFRRKIESLFAITKSTEARYLILTNGKRYELHDVTKNLNDYQTFSSTTELVQELTKSLQDKENSLSLELYKILMGLINHSKEKNIKELGKDIQRDCFDFKEGIYFFKPHIEELIVKKLLLNFSHVPQKVCRYTTLNTLFNMIDSGKLRMFGVAGMNDTTEVNYVEQCIYNDKDILPSESINQYFITSCCNAKYEDDLTFFRLYGDDAKGVCLVFSIEEKNNFNIHEVVYKNKKDSIFEFLSTFVAECEKKVRSFKFGDLHKWAHFIKSEEYSDEEEIRLVYKSSEQESGWVLAQPFNILNPYMDLNFDDIPLKLEKIILGPKCPDSKINRFQIDYLLEKKGFNKNGKIDVEESKITSYR